jgi:hypothetical protein
MDPLRVKYHKGTKFNDDADWTKFYGEVKEEDPHDMPDPLVVYSSLFRTHYPIQQEAEHPPVA